MAAAVSAIRWTVRWAALAALPVCAVAGVLVIALLVVMVHAVAPAKSAVAAVNVTTASASPELATPAVNEVVPHPEVVGAATPLLVNTQEGRTDFTV